MSVKKTLFEAIPLFVCSVLLIFLTSCAGPGRKILLAENGETGYVLIIPAIPTSEEREAAKLFRTAFSSSLGINISVKDDWLDGNETPGQKEILIGRTNREESASAYEAASPLRSVRLTSGEKLVFAGKGENGLRDAVVSFLSEYLGYDRQTGECQERNTLEIRRETVMVNSFDDNAEYPPVSEGGIFADADSFRLVSGSRILEFAVNDGYRAAVKNNEKIMFYCDGVRIRTVDGSFAEREYTVPYSDLVRTDYGCKAAAEIETDNGSLFYVIDTFSLGECSGCFRLDRKVSVVKAGKPSDKGFSTAVSFSAASDSTDRDGFEYFIPSVIYRDTADMPENAQLSSLDSVRNYVKETHTGLPMAMIRDKSNGAVLTLQHLNPDISNRDNLYRQYNSINDGVRYGSIGFSFQESASVDFVYPCSEGPVNYEMEGRNGWVNRFHPVTSGFCQEYSLALIPGLSDKYSDAMTDSYRRAWMMENPEIDAETADAGKIYDLTLEAYSGLYEEYEYSNGVKAAGTPFLTDVRGPEKNIYYNYFVNGFTGAQSDVGFELFREGLLTGNDDYLTKGAAILDFWSSDVINSHITPITWWIPDEGPEGRDFGYPTMLRHMIDGADGIRKAVLFAKEKGYDPEAVDKWERAVKKTADFLAGHQNSDGSFYRAYDYMGRPSTSTLTPAICGKSKNSTPVAVAFLKEMYLMYGDEEYKKSAIAAAEFSYDCLFVGKGKYVGGTADNPDVPDKEAAIYAMYAFNAAYELTGDKKYYDAFVHALYSAMSWTITYDYAVQYPVEQSHADVMIFENGNTSGFSSIATGHAGIDVYSACLYDDMFMQYCRTEDDIYLSFAAFLQYNSRRSCDADGSLGYLYKAFASEACIAAEFVYYASEKGIYVPWIGVAFCDPVVNMTDAFGTYDVYEAAAVIRQNKQRISTNGNG